MGRAIDLFVTYRFLRLLTTPFEDTDAFKLGIIDEKGNRIKLPKSTKPAVELSTSELKNSYTILHKLVFNIKKIFAKVPGLRTKVGTSAAALFLLKDTFKDLRSMSAAAAADGIDLILLSGFRSHDLQEEIFSQTSEIIFVVVTDEIKNIFILILANSALS